VLGFGLMGLRLTSFTVLLSGLHGYFCNSYCKFSYYILLSKLDLRCLYECSWPTQVVQWLRLALFSRPNRMGASQPFYLSMEMYPVCKILCSFRILDNGQSPESYWSCSSIPLMFLSLCEIFHNLFSSWSLSSSLTFLFLFHVQNLLWDCLLLTTCLYHLIFYLGFVF
jgi:hypothetical protein